MRSTIVITLPLVEKFGNQQNTYLRMFLFTVNGLLVVTRGCTWKRQDDYYTNCPGSTNGPNEVTTYCETCEQDGCNGASAIGKTLALLVVPLGLLLFK